METIASSGVSQTITDAENQVPHAHRCLTVNYGNMITGARLQAYGDRLPPDTPNFCSLLVG